MKLQPLMAMLALAAMLIACDRGTHADAQAGNATESPVFHYDYFARSLPLEKRRIVPAYSFPGMPEISAATARRLELQQAFFDQDFATLDPAIFEYHRRYVDKESAKHPITSFISGLEETKLAGIDSCAAWTEAMPQSYAAHWICGFIWAEGAYHARSGKYARDVTPIRFALMRERFRQSNVLLKKAIMLTPVPIEAMTMLAANHFMLGEHDKAREYVRRAHVLRPDHAALHDVLLTFASPEWGGSQEKVLEAMNAAKESGLDEITLLDYHDRHVVRPWKMSNPGAAKAYWTQAIKEKPTRYRLQQLTLDYETTKNWRDMVSAADKWIEHFPDDFDAYWRRAYAHEMLGNSTQALADYRMAAAQGSNLATQTLIRSHILGAMGLAPKDWNSLDQVCRYGAVLGLPSAANCIGSAYWEANTVDGPFKQNRAQALAWHQLAARGAYHNSQYDLGWLLLTGRVPGVESGEAREHGVFWLRRAAEQNHEFAKKKLQENGYAEMEAISAEGPDIIELIEMFGRFLRSVLWVFR